MIRKRHNHKEMPSSKTEMEKKTNLQSGTYTKKTYRKPSEQLFQNRRLLSYPNLTEKMKTHTRCTQHKKQHENINKTSGPQQKYRLGTISYIKLMGAHDRRWSKRDWMRFSIVRFFMGTNCLINVALLQDVYR